MTQHSQRSHHLARPVVWLPLLCGLLTCVSLGNRADAQFFESHTFELAPDSYYVSGCTGPSMCLCPEFVVGDVTGTLELTPLLPPLGPIFEFSVDLQALLFTDAAIPPTPLAGTGLYTVDTATGLHQMSLLILSTGAASNFTSIGFVTGFDSFPQALEIEVFAPQSTCIYDGIIIRGVAPLPQDGFIRGDANTGSGVNLIDALRILNVLFTPGTDPFDCEKAADIDDNGLLGLPDPILLLNYLFVGGAPPSAPFPNCGADPTVDNLTCDVNCP